MSKNKELQAAQAKIIKLEKELEYTKVSTGLKDRLGNEILAGNVVHWTDGGDDLPLDERIERRWDRIAFVKPKPGIGFKVIDSPDADVKAGGYSFNYGSFIYKDTENYLTIVARSVEEYNKKFKNAGECMAYVLEVNNG